MPVPIAPDAATPPPPPEKAVVPRGCEINLRGRYRLAKKPFWRYTLEDDGTHVTLTPLPDAEAGRVTAAPDAGSSAAQAMVLDRTSKGFVGLVLGQARTAAGQPCPVAFKAEIAACGPEGLTVRSDDELSLDDQCRMRRTPTAPTDKILLRE